MENIDKISYQTTGTCSKQINILIKENKIIDIEFIGGCNGNLKGIRNLVLGQDIEEIAKKLKGITCGARPTSCPDQLAICLEEYMKNKAKTTV